MTGSAAADDPVLVDGDEDRGAGELLCQAKRSGSRAGSRACFVPPHPAFRLGLAQHNDTQRGEEVVASQRRANLDVHIRARGQRFMRASVLETRQDDQRQGCAVHLPVREAKKCVLHDAMQQCEPGKDACLSSPQIAT
jgi:hypothetical protein